MALPLEREAYTEPRCPLSPPARAGSQGHSIPRNRVLEKLDQYLARRDYPGAERHLVYWLEEARQNGDEEGAFLVLNELMGLYRKLNREEEAIACAQEALALSHSLDLDKGPSGATCLVNAATVLEAFGRYDAALSHFEAAQELYEALLPANDPRLGGLYNNMGLCLSALGRYEEALCLYRRAMAIMETAPYGPWEQAVTCLNMANTLEKQKGLEAGAEEIEALMEEAWTRLDLPSPVRDGYHAFVCEKCAPTFSYYGYFAYAGELKKRSEELYAGA